MRPNDDDTDLILSPSRPDPAAPLRAIDGIAAAVLVVVVAVAFWPALWGDFVIWDDHKLLTENESFRGLGWEQIRWAFTSFQAGHYMPLVWLSWGADYLLWGEVSPFGFHLSNIVLHAINALLVYLLGLELLQRARPVADRAEECVRNSRRTALVCALLFAVHPLRVESVAWATERKDLLSGLFYLLTLFIYVRGGGRRWMWALGVFVAAVLSKVMVVSLPVVLIVLDAFPLRRLGGEAGWFGSRARRVYLEKVPFVLLALGAAVVAPFAQGQVGALTDWEVHGIGARLAVCSWGLVFYLYKTLIPIQLSPLYEITLPLNALAPRYLLSGVAVIFGAGVVWMTRRRLGALMAAAICYVAILLPVLGIIQNGPQTTGDRYSYLSCVGPVLLLCALWGRVAGKGARFAAALVPVGVLVVTLMVMTRQQCAVWQNTRSLWSQALRVDPACVFCLNGMGRALAAADEPDEAEARYREALRLNPGHADANTNLGNLLLEQERIDEALEHLAQAAALEPESGIMHYNLGNGLAAAGRMDGAVQEYERGIECRNWEPPAMVFSNLAFALNATGRFSEASAAAQRAVQSDPESGRAHYNLGVAQIRSGDIDAGAASFRSSVRCEPSEAIAYVEMARELRMSDRSAVAREILLAGLARFPDDVELARALKRLPSAAGAGGQD